ncbi:putative chitin synthase activator (Chs3) [Aspergillus stella-maris]|uniref:putative chitin synthase activator (Chs3) n=1 Tax=Aspergillus stella-maris TaxID=1810926 RepID=UPI003CCCFFBC
MNRPPQGRGQGGLSATWYPGSADDPYMPEVISPSPQRVMPEVPENMQDNIANFEHQARSPHRMHYGQAQYERPRFPDRSSSAAVVHGQVHGQPLHSGYEANHYEQSAAVYDVMDSPNFSPFPVLRNPPPNVPPTDEQREANLEKARLPVLSSNDPDMQLAWAQDVLAHVEVAVQNEARLSVIQPPRPQTPSVERQLRNDALNIVNFLADQYHPKAEFIKGMWLEFGKFGWRIDKKEAFRCYSRAAEKGYARAEYRIGMQFESSGEPEKAIRHYEKGVAFADSASYYRLGMMILLGQHGQRQDYRLGLEYISLAAQSCDENAPQGAYVYGMLLARELPQVNVPETYLPLDLNASRINIEKAAYHGFAKAQVKMGAAYELGQLSCDFNPALSLHYNALAARQGEPEAEMAISKWFLCGHEGVFEKNDELAFTYAQRAAQSGLPTAEFALGYFYEVGIFVPTDIKEAKSWYAKAAASGNKDATGRIDSISRSKTLSRRDHENVAIARIKSTRYGGHNRGASNAQSMQPVTENLEMPDPSRMSLSDNPPPSAAPYPDRGPQGRPGPGPGYPPDNRPSSAFGINPNIRPNAGQYNRAASYGPSQMGYRSPGSATSGLATPPGSHPPSVHSMSAVDIGYSAPMDPPRQDMRRRPQRLDNVPDRKPARTPVPGAMPSPRPSPSSGNFPPRAESMQSPSATPKPSSTPKPMAPPSAPATPAAPAPQKPTKAPAITGKGPKTFEEMGVPQAPKENDCIVM